MPKTKLSSCKCDYIFSLDNSVVLHRESGDRLISIDITPMNNQNCIKRLVLWIKAANFTIDIGLFFILHKEIIETIVQKSQEGVRCRVIALRHWTTGPKAIKHQLYIDRLERAGVDLRWTTEGSGLETQSRYFFVDCTDITGNADRIYNEGAYIYGAQKERHFDITKDLVDLKVLKKQPSSQPLHIRFERMWKYSRVEHEVIPESKPSIMNMCFK